MSVWERLKTKKGIIQTFVVAILLIGGAYVVILLSDTQLVSKNANLSLKWLHQAQFAGVYSAMEEGYFAESGLKVNPIEYKLGTDQFEMLRNGEADFAIISAEEVVKRVSEGEEVVALAAIYQQSPLIAVSLKESNIKNPADLKGKTVGVKGGSLEELLFYEALLAVVGLDKTDIGYKVVGFEKTELQDLTEPDIDTVLLYSVDQLYEFDNNNIKYDIIDPSRFGFNLYNDVLVVSKSKIDEDRKYVSRFVKSLIKGWDFAVANQEKAVEYTIKYVTNDRYKDIAYETYILNNSVPLIVPSNGEPIGHMSEGVWRRIIESLDFIDILDSNVDPTSIYTEEFLN